jgi:hypothetical protein
MGAQVQEKTPGIIEGLSDAARAAALRWAELAGLEGMELVFTSGRRSAGQQAAAMLGKVNRGEDLRALYRSAGDTLDWLESVPRDVDAWAWVLEQAPISAHQRGDAVDARRWGFSASQLKRLGELAIAAGFRRALLESDHLHAQL